MIKIDRNNALTGLKFDTEGAKILYFFQTGAKLCTWESTWLYESVTPKMQQKILTDFDVEIFDDETTQTSLNFSMKNARKHQFSGFCFSNR